MYHYRKTRKSYINYPKTDHCQFCDPKERGERLIVETDHTYIMPNRTFYDIWESRRVTDHLLVVPKRHVLELQELSADEQADIIKLVAEYEAKGYDVYARSQASSVRSVSHQHTHLIKTDPKMARGLFYWHKPYWLIRFR